MARGEAKTGERQGGRVRRRGALVAALAALVAGAMTFAGAAEEVGASTAPVVTALAAGWEHTCALTNNGGVLCWGLNDVGQLGDGTNNDSSVPVPVVGLSKGVTAIAAGGKRTCALLWNGGVRCWGGNHFGGVGDGTTTDRNVPVNVVGLSTGANAVTVGAFHSCALVGNGTGARCWGANDAGQVGDGTDVDRLTPVPVVGLPAKGLLGITGGGRHTCLRTWSGTAMCWGDNAFGQLGDGSNTPSATPVLVSGLSGVTQITAGGRHTCALTAAGGAKCWGDNTLGQLGDGTDMSRPVPGDVAGLTSAVRFVGAGRFHTCAITSTGAVKCWGEVSDLQGPYFSPQDIPGLNSGAASLAAGWGHTCVVVSGGSVKCFGNNDAGQLGDGSNTPSATPVDVRFS